MKVTFTKQSRVRDVTIIPYDSISRIPFSIQVGHNTTKPETITCRNLSLPNFIEFNFNFESKELYSISCISLAPENIIREKSDLPAQPSLIYYDCKLMEDYEFETSEQITIVERPSSIQLYWNERKKTRYYLNDSTVLGIDESHNLAEILLLNLPQNLIRDILGN